MSPSVTSTLRFRLLRATKTTLPSITEPAPVGPGKIPGSEPERSAQAPGAGGPAEQRQAQHLLGGPQQGVVVERLSVPEAGGGARAHDDVRHGRRLVPHDEHGRLPVPVEVAGPQPGQPRPEPAVAGPDV